MATAPTNASFIIPRPEIPQGEFVFRDDSTLQNEWSQQSSLYRHYWHWYDGKVYADNPEKFPLALNPLRTACILHRNALFGEADDTSRPLVKAVFPPDPTIEDVAQGKTSASDETIKRRRILSHLVNLAWGSAGRATMLENGLNSQILGGCVFAVRYSPWDMFSPLPIRIEIIQPEEFMPLYVPGDYWNLKAAYVSRYISKTQAKAGYGIDIDGSRGVYLEYWSAERYEITIDGKVPYRVVNGTPVAQSGINPFGVVPFVYIPHEREGSRFYGVPVMHQMEGVLQELNGRAADIGDAVRDSSHITYYGRNLNRDISTKRLNEALTVIDIGSAAPNTPEPELFPLDPPKMPSESKEFVGAVEEWIRTEMLTPDVAYGKDQGSQRSALTLAFRMWPFASHIRNERTLWTVGLNTVSEIMLRIVAAKSKADPRLSPYGVTEADFNLPKRQEWFSMLPRDEEAETNMDILRKQSGILDTKTAVERDPKIENPDEVVERIKDEQEEQAKMAQQSTMGGKAPGAPTKIPVPTAQNDPESD